MVSSYKVSQEKKDEYQFSLEDINACQISFPQFDRDNSASMDKKEFMGLLASLGFSDLSDKDVGKMMAIVDTSSVDRISWDEFVDMYGKWKEGEVNRKVKKAVMKISDVNKEAQLDIKFTDDTKTIPDIIGKAY